MMDASVKEPADLETFKFKNACHSQLYAASRSPPKSSKRICLWVYVCLCEFVCTTCVQEPREVRRCQIPRNKDYRWL
ncbi:hypothetical protein I79_025840 [Cricetulus griseus]|uniref:Uncharacterized protein n=1 Tax=Cricetulus griseus TaxID=10029 RepID=G3IPD4_CRIGR|nr:hypothetical protein I79_025840 [Cricetulus griseus]